MYQSILVPLDGSPLAEQAIAPAAAIARKSGAILTLVRVTPEVGAVTYMPYVGDEMLAALRDLYERDRIAERDYLAALAARLKEGAALEPQTALLDGRPAGAICAHAAACGADLIVMTTHGRSGLSRAWLGSVADAVIRHAGVPVLLLRPTDAATAAPRTSFDRILVPLDGSPQAQAILPPARALGSLFGARYSLVTVVNPLQPPLQVGPERASAAVVEQTVMEQRIAHAEERLREIAHRLTEEYRDVEVTTTVLVDERPAHAILGRAEAEASDLVALTTFGRGPVRLLLGSVADKILRGTTTPVLLYRPAPD